MLESSSSQRNLTIIAPNLKLGAAYSIWVGGVSIKAVAEFKTELSQVERVHPISRSPTARFGFNLGLSQCDSPKLS